MAKAFGTEQQVDFARLVSGGTSNISSTPSGGGIAGGIAAGASSLIDALSEIAADRKKKGLGRALTAARTRLGKVANQAELNINTEKEIKDIVNQFGAGDLQLVVGFLGGVNVTSRFNRETGEIVTTNALTGFTSTVGSRDLRDPTTIALETLTNQAAEFEAMAPRTSAAFERIIGAENAAREKSGTTAFGGGAEFFLLSEQQRVMINTIDAIDKANELVLALQANPAQLETGSLPRITQNIGKDVTNQIFGMLASLLDENLLIALGSQDNQTVTANSVVSLYTAMTGDIIDSLNKSGTANRLGINMNQIRTIVQSEVLPQLRAAATAQFEGRNSMAVQLLKEAQGRIALAQINAQEAMIKVFPNLLKGQESVKVLQSILMLYNIGTQVAGLPTGTSPLGTVADEAREAFKYAITQFSLDAGEINNLAVPKAGAESTFTPTDYTEKVRSIQKALAGKLPVAMLQVLKKQFPAFKTKVLEMTTALRADADLLEAQDNPESLDKARQLRRQALLIDQDLDRREQEINTLNSNLADTIKNVSDVSEIEAGVIRLEPLTRSQTNFGASSQQRQRVDELKRAQKQIQTEEKLNKAKGSSVVPEDDIIDGTTGTTGDVSTEPATRKLTVQDVNLNFTVGPDSGSASVDAVNAIVRLEGFVADAIDDGFGNLTVGHGHLVLAGETFEKSLTKKEARTLAIKDLLIANDEIDKHVKVPLTQNQRDALLLFVFNFGGSKFASSTLLKLLNEGDINGAANEFDRWIFATVKGKKVRVAGLIKRRTVEKIIFLGKSTK